MATQRWTIDQALRPSLRLALLTGAAIALCGAVAHAQTAAPAAAAPAQAKPAVKDEGRLPGPNDIGEDETEVSALIIEAQRTAPGSAIGDIQPELSLSPRDIRGYGVSSVDELITALAPQLTSGQGRDAGQPVILVNGARISSFREVRDIPVEAILRTDILPEEVSLKYGYRADQRVVNLILRPRFRAITTEAAQEFSTEGGGSVTDLHAGLFRVQRQNRLLLDAKAEGQAALLESDRDLTQPRADADMRTLIPEQSSLSLNAVVSRPLGAGVSGSLNAGLDTKSGSSKLGLNTLTGGALNRDSDSTTGHLGATAAGALKGWNWTATGNVDRADSDSTTQRIVSGLAYRDTSNSVTTSADGELMMNGRLFRVPAGQVNASFTGGFETEKYETSATRVGVASTGDLSRDTGSFKANVDIPLASTRTGVLDQLGNMSINFNAAVDDLSDFGSLSTLGAGLNWSPVSKLRMLASYTRDEGAPTVAQLGSPVQVTPGQQAYDFRTGQTVVINQISGGNSALNADTRNVFKLGGTFKPFDKKDLTFTANYVKTRTDDLISTFPTSSSQIEDAFPDRFTRNAAGQLVSIDARPVNFERRDTEQLRYGFTYRKAFGPQFVPGQRFPGAAGGQGGQGRGQGGGAPGAAGVAGGAPGAGQQAFQPPPGEGGFPPPGEGGAAAGGTRNAAGGGGAAGGGAAGGGGARGGGFGGGGFGGPPGGLGTTLQLGLYHTIKFQDEVLIRNGLPVLDLLNGGSIGSGGGEARNQIDAQANLSKNGLGAAVTAKWVEGSKVVGSGASGADDLTFSDLTTINVRLFAELRQQPWFKDHPFFRGARASLSVDNLLDQKQDVRTAAGLTPASYQNDYLDPQGRAIKVSFRKLF